MFCDEMRQLWREMRVVYKHIWAYCEAAMTSELILYSKVLSQGIAIVRHERD